MLKGEAIRLVVQQEQSHDPHTQPISPLRQRMTDDMRMRKLAPKTQAGYLRVVREFARFLGRSPDTATVEDLRRYQLHLVDHGVSPVSLNAAITGLKFFFEITLHEPDLMARMQPVRVPRVLPVVLSPDEVGRLIAATGNLKHQSALSVAYGAGLRASEVVALKVGDVDSQRMTLRIEQGKGRKDRYAMLSPVLLERMKTNHSGCPDRLAALPQRAPGEDACACRYQQTLPRSRHLYRRAAWMLQNTYVTTKPLLRPKIVSLPSS